MSRARLFIGTSGYSYAHWGGGVFYPPDVPPSEWLEYYATRFQTVELNVTFYHLPEEKTFKGWFDRTPDSFVFAVKGSRYITHLKHLKEAEEPLELFFKRASLLKKKLGVVLWQLPPQFEAHLERFEEFLKALKPYRPIRFVLEFRNPSWFQQSVYDLLEEYKIALCFADYRGVAEELDLPVTAGFVYVRRHGRGRSLYTGNYSTDDLKGDAHAIRRWLDEGRDVYEYFNNDAHGYAPKNAAELVGMLGK